MGTYLYRAEERTPDSVADLIGAGMAEALKQLRPGESITITRNEDDNASGWFTVAHTVPPGDRQ